ncbi:MAG: hypothetical protein KBC41_00905 [Candidatus Pacebacteria bacterium]|nr:hypothetical protein [Candidatus Paceibacterota bacterium]MBP9866622.1 hypothetical protein [Candidatus Paceibacterota bacterium]
MIRKEILKRVKPVLPAMYIFGVTVVSFFYILQGFGYMLLFGDYFNIFQSEDKEFSETQRSIIGFFLVFGSLSMSTFLNTIMYMAINPYTFFERNTEKNNYLDRNRIRMYCIYIGLTYLLLTKIEEYYYSTFSFIFNLFLAVCLFCFIFLERYKQEYIQKKM